MTWAVAVDGWMEACAGLRCRRGTYVAARGEEEFKTAELPLRTLYQRVETRTTYVVANTKLGAADIAAFGLYRSSRSSVCGMRYPTTTTGWIEIRSFPVTTRDGPFTAVSLSPPCVP